jgi:hypothetical protein
MGSYSPSKQAFRREYKQKPRGCHELLRQPREWKGFDLFDVLSANPEKTR